MDALRDGTDGFRVRRSQLEMVAAVANTLTRCKQEDEGVYLPLEYCPHVACAKLPFSVPDFPLEEARREGIESQGRSPFIEITVAEVAVRLKQQFGRLIRTTRATVRRRSWIAASSPNDGAVC